MTMGRYVLGIDAGGTKTVGLLADESGRVVAEARGTGANLQTQGELEVEKVFDGLIETLGRDHPISAVCLGIAGVDRPRRPPRAPGARPPPGPPPPRPPPPRPAPPGPRARPLSLSLRVRAVLL